MRNPVNSAEALTGQVEEDQFARYFTLKDIYASDLSQPPAWQAREVFEKMEASLAAVGMTFANVVRTWLFADRILGWYDQLNEVRSTFFRQRGVFSGVVPASTGVGMPNPMGAALRAELLAVAPKSPDIKVFPVASPLQCPAIDYGSSFSRAVEVDQPGQRRLYVSGTASIAPGGATAYVDDLRGQIDLTMNVVEAILASRTMSWKNVTRGVAYLKQITYTKPFGEYLSQRGLEFLPFTLVHADICRDDLLFEIELDAMVS